MWQLCLLFIKMLCLQKQSDPKISGLNQYRGSPAFCFPFHVVLWWWLGSFKSQLNLFCHHIDAFKYTTDWTWLNKAISSFKLGCVNTEKMPTKKGFWWLTGLTFLKDRPSSHCYTVVSHANCTSGSSWRWTACLFTKMPACTVSVIWSSPLKELLESYFNQSRGFSHPVQLCSHSSHQCFH